MQEPGDEDLSAIYRLRFDERDLVNKRVLWETLVSDFFQQYVPENGTVVDLGAGSCEFINSVRAARRIAVDLNPDTAMFAAPGVTVLTTRSDHLAELSDESVDTVFTSNFFEHLPDKSVLMATLAECHRVTRAGRPAGGADAEHPPPARSLLGLPRPSPSAHGPERAGSTRPEWL